MLRGHKSHSDNANCKLHCQVLILANLLCRLAVAQDLQKLEGAQGHRVDGIRKLLLRCGEGSEIVPAAERLEQMGYSYREYHKEKSDLLDILSM